MSNESWDAIVIGSGLGGLSTAAYLCAAGKRTPDFTAGAGVDHGPKCATGLACRVGHEHLRPSESSSSGASSDGLLARARRPFL